MANDEITAVTRDDTFKKFALSIPLFTGFPEALLEELQKAASVVHIDAEQTILKQGEVNKNLYFLVIGTVDIFVDGGLVASLRRKGDLLGEMSVITSKPCSATIVAKTPVELICVNIEKFRDVTRANQDQFENILYRIYSQILTDKINITNQKAKRVEETLDALQRAKNELQEINSQLELRVAERTQHLQSKLQDLVKQHLATLRKSLMVATNSADSKLKPALQHSIAEVDEVVRVIEPIVQLFALEVSMKNKRVLLAQGERKAQTVAKMALGGTGVKIETTPTIEQAKDRILNEKFDVVLIDNETLDLIDAIKDVKNKPDMIYVANKSIQENLAKLLSVSTLPNIVFVKDEDRAGCVRAIMTAVTKMCSANLFGLEKYLNVGVEVKQVKVTTSDERRDLNDKMREHFQSLGVRPSLLDNVSTVLEEILMNAIYDAPVDVMGKHLYNHYHRSATVTLKPIEQSTLRYATDGTLLAISVEDPFGALTAQTIMKYLDSCYGGRAGSLQQADDKGGAGRGLHMIIENSLFVVFNVSPKRRTEVIAFFNVTPGAGQQVEASPMMHYFIDNA